MPRNYLITGAARGIGRGLTRLLLSKGHRVLLVDNNTHELEHLNTVLTRQFPSQRSNWALHPADLSHANPFDPIATHAGEFFTGRLDVLVNNAADTSGVDLMSSEFPDRWAKTLSVNLTAAVMLTRACLSLLEKTEGRGGGGSVVMVSSTRARQSERDSEGYAATKAGLVGLTHALACSLAPRGVRVNAVLPGWIDVSRECRDADEGRSEGDEISKEDREWHWSGRVGRVEDVLRAVEYLSGPDGDGDGDGDDGVFVTGTEMVVDGGVSRKMVYPE